MPHKDPGKTATKRAADDTQDNDHDSKRSRKAKGFTVGPAHLPDGAWKRKNQQLKRALIEQAKLKKDYARLQAREAAAVAEADTDTQPTAPPAVTMHPDRQTMIDRGPASPEPEDRSRTYRRRERRPKPAPFAREQRAADKVKSVAEERRKAREEAEAQRNARLEERERFRKAMAKARTGGRNGQRKLGRESGVLLEKVRRMVAEG